jgi:zinc transport system substrate-binding protein
MKQKLILGSLAIVLVIALAIIIGHTQTSQNQKNEKTNVVVSILPQKAFVQAVGGDFVTVTALIPPGASPESYDPSPSDLKAVENADIYFRIGYIPFEKSNAEKLAELNPKMKIVDTSTNIQMKTFDERNITEEEGIDPHIWLSPVLVKTQIDMIAQTLSGEDPAHAAIYKDNAQNYKKQLDELDSQIRTELKDVNATELMVFHPAWGYFADEFGLKEIAIEQSGKEPTAKQLQNLIKEAKDNNIKVIFVSPEFDKNVANSLAEEVGASVVSIDPLAEDYINNLKNVATTIAASLKK